MYDALEKLNTYTIPLSPQEGATPKAKLTRDEGMKPPQQRDDQNKRRTQSLNGEKRIGRGKTGGKPAPYTRRGRSRLRRPPVGGASI